MRFEEKFGKHPKSQIPYVNGVYDAKLEGWRAAQADRAELAAALRDWVKWFDEHDGAGQGSALYRQSEALLARIDAEDAA